MSPSYEDLTLKILQALKRFRTVSIIRREKYSHIIYNIYETVYKKKILRVAPDLRSLN